MTSSYGEIVERLEKLTGPDREMDARIWAHFFKVRYIGHNMAYAAYGASNPLTQVEFTTPPKRTRCVTGSPQYPHATPVTASLDDSVALVEKKLPGFGHGYRMNLASKRFEANVYAPYWWTGEGPQTDEYAEAVTPALALLKALFRALTVNENG